MLVIDVAHAGWTAWERRTAAESAFDALRGRLHTLAARFGDVVLAVDMPPYERADETLGGSATYKANRSSDEAGRAAVRAMLDGLRRDGWRMVGVQGHEADDVCATLARQAHARGERITVATSDKDLLPLLDIADLWWLGSDRLITPDDVRGKWGVEPWQLHDLLALMGDDSDGIAGVPGIGQQKGAALLQHYRNIDAILADPPAAKETIDEAAKALATKRKRAKAMPDGDERRTALALADEAERLGKIARAHALVHQHRGAVELARRLVRLRSDLPIYTGAAGAPEVTNGKEDQSGEAVGAVEDVEAGAEEGGHHEGGAGQAPQESREGKPQALTMTEEPMKTETAETITEAETVPVAQPLALRPVPPDPRPSILAPTEPAPMPAAPTTRFRCSPKVGALMLALAEAQGEIEPAVKDSHNDHTKKRYADLASVWKAIRAPLSKHKIAVVQNIVDGHLVTRLHHGEEWMESEVKLALDTSTGRTPVQALGSAITYLRRYVLSAMAGVAPDDDDDGASDGRNFPQQRRAS